MFISTTDLVAKIIKFRVHSTFPPKVNTIVCYFYLVTLRTEYINYFGD